MWIYLISIFKIYHNVFLVNIFKEVHLQLCKWTRLNDSTLSLSPSLSRSRSLLPSIALSISRPLFLAHWSLLCGILFANFNLCLAILLVISFLVAHLLFIYIHMYVHVRQCVCMCACACICITSFTFIELSLLFLLSFAACFICLCVFLSTTLGQGLPFACSLSFVLPQPNRSPVLPLRAQIEELPWHMWDALGSADAWHKNHEKLIKKLLKRINNTYLYIELKTESLNTNIYTFIFVMPNFNISVS